LISCVREVHVLNMLLVCPHSFACYIYKIIERINSEVANPELYQIPSRRIWCVPVSVHQAFHYIPTGTQYIETNVMHFLFSLLRIKSLYMFRATRCATNRKVAGSIPDGVGFFH
jgi:hypothetical protein